MTRRIPSLFFILFAIAACVPVTSGTESVSSTSATPDAWWRNAIFYEIFVRSFYDTNNDGIGDFNGIIEKLDYLEELGITAIWLMPIHPSPSYHGYDVINYYAVNSEYGTMDDFKRLLEEAHKRDMRVIIDLVVNHTSSQHPFFVDADNNPGSLYRDWYIWSESDPGNGWHAGNLGFYYGLFWEGMPDLNYNNPEVTAFMENVVRFWLDEIGVDGFRVDAAKHLIEDGRITENTTATHEWLKRFYKAYKTDRPDVYTVGEVFGAGALMVKSYTGNQLDQVFNFEMANGFVNSANGGSNSGINSAIRFSLQDMPDFNFATFLTNHDQNRVMSVLNGNTGKAKVAAALLLTSPGTPFIYYGEEIGMQGKKPDEDIRLPMQWSGGENAGFSGGRPWRPVDANYVGNNVQIQTDNPDSLLSHYRSLISLRKKHPALRLGDIFPLETGNPGVYSVLQIRDDDILLVIVNLEDEVVSDYQLSLEMPVLKNGKVSPVTVFGKSPASTMDIQNNTFVSYIPFIQLAPFETYVLQLNR